MNNELIKLTEAELEDLVTSWGYPRFRAKQIHEWVHRHHAASFDTMSNLPKDLRTKLSEFFPLETVKIFDRQISLDGTRKYVVTLADGSLVETVGMPVYHRDGSLDRLSVCVSSQVGCPMACQFCATGREGLTRNLTAAEIIAQVALVQEDFQERVSNVVVMGQGEPFLNYDEVLADIIRRDELDSSRDTAPLRPAEDAIQIDSTGKYIEDIIAMICAQAQARM